MTRIARLAAPTGSAIALRTVQLLVLVSIGVAAEPPSREALIGCFGVLSAFAVLSDSGAATFLLSSPRDRLTARVVLRVLAIHAWTTGVGAVLAAAYCLASFGDLGRTALGVLASLAVTQLADGLVRAVRTPALVHGADVGFALYDLGLALGKLPWVSLAMVTGDVRWLLGLPVLSGVLLVLASRRLLRTLPRGSEEPPRARRVLGYGVNGAASALYSQGPLLVAAATMPISTVAVLTICYRVLQPLELVPATISQQLVPRATAGTVSIRPAYVGLTLLGLAAASGAVAALPIMESVFSLAIDTGLFVILAASVPVKFGNYALTAFLFARGLLMSKLRVTSVVGALAVASALAAAALGSATAIVCVTLAAELLLTAGSGAALAQRKGRP